MIGGKLESFLFQQNETRVAPEAHGMFYVCTIQDPKRIQIYDNVRTVCPLPIGFSTQGKLCSFRHDKEDGRYIFKI